MLVPRARRSPGLALTAVILLATAGTARAAPGLDIGGVLTGLLGHAPGRPALPPPSRCPVRHSTDSAPAGQPVFPCDFPDPMVFYDSPTKTWVAYATSTGWDHAQHLFPMLRSPDLHRWRWVGDAFHRTPRWSSGELWAPNVIHARGRYYLFYSAKRRRDDIHCVGVATAAGPVGPFRDRGPVACLDTRGMGYIDPAVLVTSKTRAYVYYSVDRPHHSISVQPLRHDLLRPSGRRRELFRVGPSWQRGLAAKTVEGPYALRRGGRVYLFFSAGCWCVDYRMGYATAASPMGRFVDSDDNPMLVGTPELVAPGGGSLFRGPGGSTQLAFQAWTGASAYRQGGSRTMRIAPITWNGPVAQTAFP
jgi:xylan 1,4-beta-xylosidase